MHKGWKKRTKAGENNGNNERKCMKVAGSGLRNFFQCVGGAEKLSALCS